MEELCVQERPRIFNAIRDFRRLGDLEAGSPLSVNFGVVDIGAIKQERHYNDKLSYQVKVIGHTNVGSAHLTGDVQRCRLTGGGIWYIG